MSFRFAADPPRRFSPRSVNLRAFTRLWRGETDRPHDTAAIAMSFLGLVNSGGALGDLGGSPPRAAPSCRLPADHAAHRINDAGKLDQQKVIGGLDNGAVVRRDHRVNDLAV
jgi:hypothetical protein